MIITGSPVAIANTKGKYKPDELAIVIGISIPKYNTPLYGQKASANTIPSNNALKLQPFFELSCIFSVNLPNDGNLMCIISNIKTPIIISNGPKNFSPFAIKIFETLNLLAPKKSITPINV